VFPFRIQNKNKQTPLTAVHNTPNEEDMKDLLSAVLVDNDLEDNQIDDDNDIGEDME
jgi:hypothetical protein